MRLVVVSDSHLSPGSPAADQNWDAVVAHIAATAPDLVVHGGDLAADGDSDPGDLVHARRRLDELTVPWRVVAGNHDVGNPWIERARLVAAQRSYEDVIGERFWSLDTGPQPGDWRLVGLDVQALLSGHPDDEPGWSWLADRLATDQPVAVFQHRPLAPTSASEKDTDRRYWPEPYRARFRDLLTDSTVRLVVSGHVHQWRSEISDGIRFVWAPSTWAAIADRFQPVIGTKVVGLVEIDLDGDAEVRLVIPDGIEQNVHEPTVARAN